MYLNSILRSPALGRTVNLIPATCRLPTFAAQVLHRGPKSPCLLAFFCASFAHLTASCVLVPATAICTDAFMWTLIVSAFPATRISTGLRLSFLKMTRRSLNKRTVNRTDYRDLAVAFLSEYDLTIVVLVTVTLSSSQDKLRSAIVQLITHTPTQTALHALQPLPTLLSLSQA